MRRSKGKLEVVFATILLLLMTVFVAVPKTAKADNPVPVYNLSFSSQAQLESFFQSHNFYLAKYNKDDGKWHKDASIEKSMIYKPNKFYAIAPYFYDDEQGYPHLIYPEGVFITLRDISSENATIVISGFRKSTISVDNVRSHVEIGRGVNYAGHGVNEGGPPWWAYTVIGSLYYAGTSTANYYNIRKGVWRGDTDSIITVKNCLNVSIDNYGCFVEQSATPVLVENTQILTIKNALFNPPENTFEGGDAIYIKNVNEVRFEGKTQISRFTTGIHLVNVKNVVQSGYVYIEGGYFKGENKTSGGTGIYADTVNNYTPIQNKVDASGKIYVGVEGFANLNNTNRTIWGNISDAVLLFKNGKNKGDMPDGSEYWYIIKENRTFKGNITNPITWEENGTANGSFEFTPELSSSFSDSNSTTHTYINGSFSLNIANIGYIDKFWNITVPVENETGAIINTSAKHIHFYGYGFTDSGAYVKGKLPYGLAFSNLNVGVGVPDNGSNEQELIEKINATAIFINVNTRISYFAEYTSGIYPINFGGAFGGLVAIISVLVAVGWVRVGTKMLSPDPNKKKEAKDLMFKASVGTLITVVVLFGWANALGLFNWIMGG